MGVYIKDMEMPTSCRACIFSRTDIRNVDWCVLTEKDLPCDCPIIPVPKHGRLIDADAFWVEINNICDRRDAGIISDLTCLQQILSALRHAPTIIPAEEGET